MASLRADTRSLGAAAVFLLALVVLQWGVFVPRANESTGNAYGLHTFDFHAYFLPRYLYGNQELLAGRLPVWNRLEFAGQPFLATIQPAVLYPPKIACFALFPLDRATLGLPDRPPDPARRSEACSSCAASASGRSAPSAAPRFSPSTARSSPPTTIRTSSRAWPGFPGSSGSRTGSRRRAGAGRSQRSAPCSRCSCSPATRSFRSRRRCCSAWLRSRGSRSARGRRRPTGPCCVSPRASRSGR